MGYSIQIKETLLQKALSGRRTQHEIATEFGVGKSTIQNWLRNYRNNGNINMKSKGKRPKDWTPEERISALIETGAMTPEEFSSWCRKKGIFSHHLEQWKKDVISGISNIPEKQMLEKESRYKKEISSLKRDLNRKEKALAETAALLVLKKKPSRSGGSPRKIDIIRRQAKDSAVDFRGLQSRRQKTPGSRVAGVDNPNTSALEQNWNERQTVLEVLGSGYRIVYALADFQSRIWCFEFPVRH